MIGLTSGQDKSSLFDQSVKEMTIDRFINDVDVFFITKSERVIFRRVKRDDIICSDCSSLAFWKFFVFLDSLVPTPRGISADDPQ